MTDLRNSQWNLESKVDGKLQSVDTKLTNYDTKLDRFEIKVEKVKTDMEKRIQESLDNPLANQETTWQRKVKVVEMVTAKENTSNGR